jgi:hypothetical protein
MWSACLACGRHNHERRSKTMQVIHARCAGLDVHKKTVVACVWLTAENGRATKETRTFGTTTADRRDGGHRRLLVADLQRVRGRRH